MTAMTCLWSQEHRPQVQRCSPGLSNYPKEPAAGLPRPLPGALATLPQQDGEKGGTSSV